MRFGVIGCGWITGAVHGPAYLRYMQAHPEVIAAACCDVDAGRAESTRDRFGFRRAWSDPAAMLAEERLDAVCLNVPPALTCAIGCHVLRRGIALLCEKPPGLTVDELEQMIAAAKEGGGAHMVAFNRRWLPLARALRAMLGEKPVEHVHYTLSRVGRSDADFSTTAIHAIDAARFLAGRDYRRVELAYQALHEVGPGVANVSIRAEMANGALAEIALTPLAGMAVERALVSARGWSAELHCPIGADGQGSLRVFVDGRIEAQMNGVEAAGGDEAWLLEGFYQEDAAFFDALLAGAQPPDGLETARQPVAIMQAMRERKREVDFR